MIINNLKTIQIDKKVCLNSNNIKCEKKKDKINS